MDGPQNRINCLKHFPVTLLLITSILSSGCQPKQPDHNNSLKINLPTQLKTRSLSGNCAGTLWADVLIDNLATQRLQKTGDNWQGKVKLTPGAHALKIEFRCTTDSFGTILLATYVDTINLSANDNLSLSSNNYEYPDNDQDGNSNLAEIKAGSDPGSASNGFKWANPLPQGNSLLDVIWNGSEFLAVGASGSILTSGNGESWSLTHIATSSTLNGIAWSGTQYVIVGSQGRILSRAGMDLDWTIRDSGTKSHFEDIVWTGNLFVAVGWEVVATSTDGIHWTTHTIPDGPVLFGVTWTGNKLVAAGAAWNADTKQYEGAIFSSTDGASWSSPQLTGTPLLSDITWTGNQLVAVGGDRLVGIAFNQGGIILTSPDGKDWVKQVSGTDVDLFGVDYESSSGQIIIVGGGSNTILPENADNGAILTSTGGVNWSLQDSTSDRVYKGLASSSSQTIVVGYAGIIKLSSDLQHWNNRTSGTLNVILDMVSTENQVVAVGERGGVLTSPDGRSWASRNSGIKTTLWGVAWTGTLLVAVGGEMSATQDGIILTSTDGITWTNRTPAGSLGLLRDVTWTGSQLVAVGAAGLILTSPNGIDWTSRNSATSNWLMAVSSNSDHIVASGLYGMILTSSDGGASWVSTNGRDENLDVLDSITWTGSSFVAVGGTHLTFESREDSGKVFTSPDGTNWTAVDPGTKSVLLDVTWTGTQLLAIATNSNLLSSLDGIAWTATPTISSNEQSSVIKHQGITLIGGGHGTILYQEN